MSGTHIAGPVFKENISFARRRPSHTNLSASSTARSTISVPHDESKALITKLQIQVDGSKKALSSICDEMKGYLTSERIDLDPNETELIKFISNVSIICRMIMRENDEKDSEIAKLKDKMSLSENEFHLKIKEMEETVKSIVDDKNSLADKFRVETRSMKEELLTLKAEKERSHSHILTLESELASVRKKATKLEDRLFDMPRVEEQVLKKAKQEIKSKEISLNRRESKWKRLEAEVGEIKTWKDKADGLESTVLILRRQIEEQERQNRKTLSSYQRSMAQCQTQIRSMSIHGGHSPSQSPVNLPYNEELSQFVDTAGMSGTQSAVRLRPSSANASSHLLPQSRPVDARPKSAVHTHTAPLSRCNSGPSVHSVAAGSQQPSKISKQQSMGTMEDTSKAVMMAKLNKAVALNAVLDKKVRSLAKKLSFARAYPLLAMQTVAVKSARPVKVDASNSRPPGSARNEIRSNEMRETEIDDEEMHFNHMLLKRRLDPAAQSDSDASVISSDDDEEVSEVDPQELARQRDNSRVQNHRDVEKMMIAINGPKAKRLTFHPPANWHNDDKGDDASVDWLDPKVRREEHQRMDQREEYRGKLSADLRQRIDANREKRAR